MTDLYAKRGCHFGSLTEPAIRNVELCEDDYPKRCLQPREACEQSPAMEQWRFRISELTRLVPAPVRSALWNDVKDRRDYRSLS